MKHQNNHEDFLAGSSCSYLTNIRKARKEQKKYSSKVVKKCLDLNIDFTKIRKEGVLIQDVIEGL